MAYKVYQTMFRVVKESETVDSRQNCFLLQNSSHEPKYLSVETRQELLRIENSWNTAIVTSVLKLGVSRFTLLAIRIVFNALPILAKDVWCNGQWQGLLWTDIGLANGIHT